MHEMPYYHHDLNPDQVGPETHHYPQPPVNNGGNMRCLRCGWQRPAHDTGKKFCGHAVHLCEHVDFQSRTLNRRACIFLA